MTDITNNVIPTKADMDLLRLTLSVVDYLIREENSPTAWLKLMRPPHSESQKSTLAALLEAKLYLQEEESLTKLRHLRGKLDAAITHFSLTLN